MPAITEIAAWIAESLKSSLTVRGVATVLVVAGVIWIACGVRLRGRMLAGWLLVPVLMGIASVCVAGQQRLAPDRSFEGPHLIHVAHNDAITLADLAGVALGGIACLLALALIWRRVTRLRG